MEEVKTVGIIDVVELLRIETQKKSSDKYTIYCPNPHHNDKNMGNCIVNTSKNTYYCYSCSEGGDVIDLVSAALNLSFSDSVEYLIEQFNLSGATATAEKRTFLSNKEYRFFNLMPSAKITLPSEEDCKQHPSQFYRYSINDIAEEDPVAHDQLLTNKFIESLYLLSLFEGLLKMEYFNKISKSLYLDYGWIKTIDELANHYFALYKKGLINKERSFSEKEFAMLSLILQKK